MPENRSQRTLCECSMIGDRQSFVGRVAMPKDDMTTGLTVHLVATPPQPAD